MKISPTLSEVRQIAATGNYNVLPVSMELLSDFITPIEAMRILQNVSTHCYMLESAQASEYWEDIRSLDLIQSLKLPVLTGRCRLEM